MKRVMDDNPNTAGHWDDVYTKEGTQDKIRLDYIRASLLCRWAAVRWHELNRQIAVLDVGCGVGESRKIIEGAIPDVMVHGVDISPIAIEYCREECAPGENMPEPDESPETRFQVADAENLPHADGRFDVVWCGETIEHTSDPEKAVKELFRVAGEWGLVIISLPYRGRNRDPDHTHEFSPADVMRWADANGELLYLNCRAFPDWISMVAVIRKAWDSEPS